MDKYEYRLKAEQIEKLVEKRDYHAAAGIADTIDWRRVKNFDILYLVAEAYEQAKRYEDCMEILNIAYDRAPVGRMLLYKMTEISAKLHHFDEAISLYREFVKSAPHDQSRYVLKYQIYRERGSSVEDQIKILREYKVHEYQERWAYELAALYAEAGKQDDCVRECDELILWFSEGQYVLKALELKQKFAPLTAAQRGKYEELSRKSAKKRTAEARFEKSGVPEFSTDRFNTMNLQAELAANLDELLKEDATVELPELNLEQMEMPKAERAKEKVLEVPELQIPEFEVSELEVPEMELPELEVPELEASELEVPELVAPELEMPEMEAPELEIPELKVPELEVPKPETPKTEVLKSEIPKAAAPNPDISAPEVPEAEPSEIEMPDLDDLMSLIPSEPEKADTEKAPEQEAMVEKQITGQMTIDDILSEWENKKAETEAVIKANEEKERVRKDMVKQETSELIRLISSPPEGVDEEVQGIIQEIDEEQKERAEDAVTIDDLPQDPETSEEDEIEITYEDLDVAEDSEKPAGKTVVSSDTGSLTTIQELERSLAEEVSGMEANAGHLTEEQERLFAYFTSVRGMSQQLSVLFAGENRGERINSSKGNLVITGKPGNGKTTLAIDIVKALQQQKLVKGKTLAKISAGKLNTKDIYEVLGKLKGGALIIESAGALTDGCMMALGLAMEGDTGGLLIILEDSAEEIQNLFRRNKNFASKFDHTIDIPVFTNDELVAFGKSYAQEQDYVFDNFAMLALYDKVGNRQTIDHLVTVAEVKEIVDAAITRAEKGSVRHILDRITGKNLDESGKHLLREEDFDE